MATIVNLTKWANGYGKAFLRAMGPRNACSSKATKAVRSSCPSGDFTIAACRAKALPVDPHRPKCGVSPMPVHGGVNQSGDRRCHSTTKTTTTTIISDKSYYKQFAELSCFQDFPELSVQCLVAPTTNQNQHMAHGPTTTHGVAKGLCDAKHNYNAYVRAKLSSPGRASNALSKSVRFFATCQAVALLKKCNALPTRMC